MKTSYYHAAAITVDKDGNEEIVVPLQTFTASSKEHAEQKLVRLIPKNDFENDQLTIKYLVSPVFP